MAQHTGIDSWTTTFRNFLTDHRYSRPAIKSYSIIAKRFLRHIESRGIAIKSVQPSGVAAYLRLELNRYRRRHGRHPGAMNDWRWHFLAPIHKLLALVQGVWPPISLVDAQVQWFAGELKAAQHSSSTISTYARISRDFLNYLHRKGVDLKDVEPSHVSGFIDEELRRYRKRHRRLPGQVVEWRCGLTSPIHLLLRKVRGVWPPPESPHPQTKQLEGQLKKDGFVPATVSRHLFRARHFLGYLGSRGIAVELVKPCDIRAYRSKQLTTYRKRHGREPLNERQWGTLITAPIHRLLRVVFGVWPPGSEPDPIIEEFRRHLVAHGFSSTVIPSQLSAIRCLLRYLTKHKKTLISVQPEDVSCYLKARLVLYRRRNGCTPHNMAGWRYRQTGPIHRLLCMVQGEWPPARPAANVLEASRGEILSAYTSWMVDLRGLSQPTVRKNNHAAGIFLEWLKDGARAEKLPELTVLDLDRFLAWRNPKLRRATRSGVVHCLRDFLRFLHYKGYLQRDLAPAVPRVNLYRFEDVPKALRPDQIRGVLEHIYKDKTPVGLRDYAITVLLATYGLRAGEIVRLRLEDINWKREEFCVIQSKSHLPLRLPLSIEVGNAILRYLRRGRPHSKAREIFLKSRAPQGPFRYASSLGAMIARRLQQAAIRVDGRRGTHAFRHAHAVDLLRAQVPFKTIGDLLGHRSPASTTVYLKLATDDLRSVALEVPGGAR